MKYLPYTLLISTLILTGNVSAAGGGWGNDDNGGPPAWMSGGPDRSPWGAWPGGPWGNSNAPGFENFAEPPPGWGAYPPGPRGRPPFGAFMPWGADNGDQARDKESGFPMWGESNNRRRGGMGNSPSPRNWERYPPADRGGARPERFPRGYRGRPAQPDTAPRNEDKQQDEDPAADMMGYPNWLPEGYSRQQKQRESTKRRDYRGRDYRDYRDYDGGFPDNAYRDFPAFPDREAFTPPPDGHSFMGFPQGFDNPFRHPERGGFQNLPESFPPMPTPNYDGGWRERDDDKQRGGFQTLPKSMPFPPAPPYRQGGDEAEQRGGFQTLPQSMPFPPMPRPNPFSRKRRTGEDNARRDDFQTLPSPPSQPVKRDKESDAGEDNLSARQEAKEHPGGFQTLPLSFPVPNPPPADKEDETNASSPTLNASDDPRSGGFVSLPPDYPFPDMTAELPNPAAYPPGYGPAYFDRSPEEVAADE